MLDHTHTVRAESLEDIYDASGKVVGKKGRTTTDQQHFHEVEDLPRWPGPRDFHERARALDHQAREQGGETVYDVSGPQGLLRARVPYYGKLHYLDRKGVDVAKGISVGSEWTYRSFIEGGTPAAAIWTFDGINDSSFRKDENGAQTLPIELVVRVFRTYKGNIERGIQGVLQLRNPDDKTIKSEPWTFTAKDNSINSFDFSRKLNNDQQNNRSADRSVDFEGRPVSKLSSSASIGPSITDSPSQIATSACQMATRYGTSSKPRAAFGFKWCW